MGSVTSFIDFTGKVLPTGVAVVQRASRQPLRWLCRCVTCGSERVFDHSKVVAALNGAFGNVAQCDLSQCRLFGTAKMTEPPTPRPDHSKDEERKVTVPVQAPTPKPPPAPAPHPLWSEYQRAYGAWIRWGQKPCTFDSFQFLQKYKQEFYQELMGNVATSEQELARQAELERLGAELEQQFNDDFNRRYNIAIVANTRGRT